MRRVAAGVPARRKVTTAPSPFLTPAPLLRSSLPPLDATSPREMPPFPSKGAALLPIPRGKKYFNIYLKVSAGNGISPSLTPPLPPIGLWKSRIRFRAVFRVFSVNEHRRIDDPSATIEFKNSREEKEEGLFLFSKTFLENSNGRRTCRGEIRSR